MKLKSIDWYSRLGEPENEMDVRCVQDYLTAIGQADCTIRYAADVEAVKAYTKVNFDPDWLCVEEDHRDRLLLSIGKANLNGFHRSLQAIIHPMADRVMEAAQSQLATNHMEIQKVAAGCAIEMCYQYALESAVSSDSAGVFGSKLNIFKQGRWPLSGMKNIFTVY